MKMDDFFNSCLVGIISVVIFDTLLSNIALSVYFAILIAFTMYLSLRFSRLIKYAKLRKEVKQNEKFRNYGICHTRFK